MGARSDGLAAKVEKSNNELLAAVEASTPEQWSAKCSDGEWTQGFVGFNAASSIGFITGMVQGIAAGQPFPATTMEAIDQGNAVMAKEHAGCTKSETIALIKGSAPGASSLVRSLTDDQLDRKVKLLETMPEITVEAVIEMLLVGHAAGHLATITGAR